MTTDDVVHTSDTDGVRTLTLHRPDSYNALNTTLKQRLLEALREASANRNVRAVLLTGSGKAFCAGQDLKEHIGQLQAGDPAPLRTVAEHYNPIVHAIVEMPKPVLAAVNGAAAGAGAALAYASDLRLAASSASFSMAFAGVGLGPDTGASWTLQRLVGYGRAAELMLLGRKVEVDEALRIGLVSEVVDSDALAERAHQLAATLASGPTTAYAKIKDILTNAAESTLPEALAAEHAAQTALGATADHQEAVQAFVDKRTPQFTGS